MRPRRPRPAGRGRRGGGRRWAGFHARGPLALQPALGSLSPLPGGSPHLRVVLLDLRLKAHALLQGVGQLAERVGQLAAWGRRRRGEGGVQVWAGRRRRERRGLPFPRPRPPAARAPATNSSKRSVTPFFARCGLASGLISTGCSSTKVGCTSADSATASNISLRMMPVEGAALILPAALRAASRSSAVSSAWRLREEDRGGFRNSRGATPGGFPETRTLTAAASWRRGALAPAARPPPPRPPHLERRRARALDVVGVAPHKVEPPGRVLHQVVHGGAAEGGAQVDGGPLVGDLGGEVLCVWWDGGVRGGRVRGGVGGRGQGAGRQRQRSHPPYRAPAAPPPAWCRTPPARRRG
jgi:hypothetical protein